MNKPERRLYESVSSVLADQIAAGSYAVGQRLPSERDLAVQFDVSRPTVREAMIALEVDGLVEVRKGSGVYVIASAPRAGSVQVTEAGPFELLEARRVIEAEACALAATRVSDEGIAELEALLAAINSGRDFAESEAADRTFHMRIAEYTENSAMQDAITMLWEARERSPQYGLLSKKAHDAGFGPDVDEHALILEALRARDPVAARNAMRMHLRRVMDTLLEITEVEEVEGAKQRVRAQRAKFSA